MFSIDLPAREMLCKIVYYGPARCGKTTNLKVIYSKIRSEVKGRMLSIDTQRDKTLFFDFLPLDLGQVCGMVFRIQLYTVPGQVYHNATRKLLLNGVHGVVFVADSLKIQRRKNIESLQDLQSNLREAGMTIEHIPLVMQYNKRDLEGAEVPILPTEVMERDLNSRMKVQSFVASAVEGYGVFETLRAITKMVAKDVSRKVLLQNSRLSKFRGEIDSEALGSSCGFQARIRQAS